MIFIPGLRLCLFKDGFQPNYQAAHALIYLTTEEVIEGIFADKDNGDKFSDSEGDSLSEEENPNATDDKESVLSRKRMKKLNKNKKHFPMISHKLNKKKTLMILQSYKANLTVVKKTSNHLKSEQEWVVEDVVESEAGGSEEGELEEEGEINLDQQPV